MSKYLKSFITVCLIACMAVCLGIFAAGCTDDSGENGNDDKYFTVTVTLPDNTPVANADAQICTMDGSIVTCLDIHVKTDSNGVAKFNLSAPTDVTDSTIFLVKLDPASLPDGYIYADDSGTEYNYKQGEGKEFDTKVTGMSGTIKLTSTNSPEPPVGPTPGPVDNDIVLGKRLSAVKDTTYTFTAEETGEYKFTALGYYNDFEWTLNGEKQTDEDKVLTLAKAEKVEITVNYACSVYVVKNLGSSTSPVKMTLGTAHNFEVNLIKVMSPMSRQEVLAWNTDSNNYYVEFTTEAAGSYKVAITSEFVSDNLDIVLEPKDPSSATPDIAWPEKDETSTNPSYYIINELEANTDYVVYFTPYDMDYEKFNCTEGHKINYTVNVTKETTVEKDLTLALGVAKSALLGEKLTFTAPQTGTYLIKFTDTAQGFYWTVNNGNTPKATTSEEITLNENEVLTINPGTNCTVTVTTKTTVALTDGVLHGFSVNFANVDSYDVTFNPAESATYKVTVTFPENCGLILNVDGAVSGEKEIDTTFSWYEFTLTASTNYTISLTSTSENDSDSLYYTVKIEKVVA